ncbi:MAG: N-6 DNA methylase [Anaerolineae bacterium]|nr:N-6 DNA methylase [Anaerolineae bacterium]
MPALETYLRELRDHRGTTTPETSLYPALKALLDEAGSRLKPAVIARVHPANQGAGIPDLGLYDAHQPEGQLPAHGVIEVKPVEHDLLAVAQSPQVAKYLELYGQVLVTNTAQFVLITQGGIEERYDLAPDAKTFWQAASHPQSLAAKHEAALLEYLMRVMRRNAPLAAPKEVAWLLASYAREARARLDVSPAELHKLDNIRGQLEVALGVHFHDEKAGEFFRSTFVQTLFYGVFAAWVLWHERRPARGERFEWLKHTRQLNVPVVQELFTQFSAANTLPTSVEQVLEWTADALNRVDQARFFEQFERDHAIQYFYEPFLEAFDPELRKQLGVWYTPPEIVRYMVARVDAALKEDLGIADGLADQRVIVLDPACGTGAYLVEVLRHIQAIHEGRDGHALAAAETARAAQTRIYGFEILPAPFVVAHMQIGMLLTGWGAELKAGQRAGVYLTNALTGWEPPEGPKAVVLFPELSKERDAAEQVKQGADILVILGNPPYSGFAGVAVDEERDLVDGYRGTHDPALPKPQGQGLNDLYVRFFRMAERRITERGSRLGVVSFISNYSWLDGLSHTGMREHLLREFDVITVDNLHGDRIISEYAPDGRTSETVFAMQGSSTGIKIGTAIATLVRREENNAEPAALLYRDFDQARADERRKALETSLITGQPEYAPLSPLIELGLPFKPRTVGEGYLDWPRLPELFPISFPGVKTSNDADLVGIDADELAVKAARLAGSIGVDHNALSAQIVRYMWRPFDMQFLFWSEALLDRPRPEFFAQSEKPNVWLEARQKSPREAFDRGIFTRRLSDNLGNGLSSYFPLFLYTDENAPRGLFDEQIPLPGTRRPNLSDAARNYLAGVFDDSMSEELQAETLFYHALAVLHAPGYRAENAGGLRQDWPRVPLPSSREIIEMSAAFGRQVAALLDVETPVPGVTQGNPRPELRSIAVLSAPSSPDFAISAGWGYRGANGVMPGQGKLAERADGTLDVYLNDTTYWANVPLAVWEYTLGGYQVLKKWLSYREEKVLGRPLRPDEARDFMHNARRISALLALSGQLDANYRVCAAQKG